MTAADIIPLIKKQPVGFACGLVSLLLVGVLYLRSDIIEENQVEYEARSAEAAKLISNVSVAKNLPEQVEEIQAHTKEMESRLVHGGQLALNLQYFYKLEAENEVKLLDVRQNTVPKNAATNYVGIPYLVTVQGTFKQTMAFLSHLENGRHFCRFSTVNFSKAPGGGDRSASAIMTLAINLELLGQP